MFLETGHLQPLQHTNFAALLLALTLMSLHFYVNDALLSCLSEDAAVELMKKTQIGLRTGGQLKLPKSLQFKVSAL